MGPLRVLGPALLGLAVLAGCERRAPGPEDCVVASMRLLGVTDERYLEVPRVKQAVDNVTFQCLTTPFDRQLTRCLEERHGDENCLLEFRARLLDAEGADGVAPYERPRGSLGYQG